MQLLVLAHNAKTLATILQQHTADLPELILATDRRWKPVDDDHITYAIAEPALLAECLKHHPEALPHLTWVHSTFAGIECLVPHANKRKWILTRMNRGFEQPIAEYVIGHVLAYHYHHEIFRKQQYKHLWDMRLAIPLQGKTLGLIGTGAVTKRIRQLAPEFGLNVIGVNRSGKEDASLRSVYKTKALLQAAPKADIWVNALPLTKETKGILDAAFFSRMRNNALFINIGRGPTVQEDAMLIWLKTHPHAYAICDVFTEEPLPETSPLWDMKNLLITPHMAAKSQPEDVVQHWLENWHALKSEQPLQGVVDLNKEY